MAQTSLALKDLSSFVLSLQQDLKSLKLEQSKEQSLLGEILSLVGTIMNAPSSGSHSRPVQMIDNTVQTSPGLEAMFCAVSEGKCYYKGGDTFHYSEKEADQSFCPVTRTSSEILSSASFQVRGSQPFKKQRHIESDRSDPNGWQKSYHLRSVAMSSPNPVATSIVTTLVQDPKKHYLIGGPLCIEPVKSLNGMNKNKSATWIEVPREKKVPKRPQRCQTFSKKKRALILPQRRLNQGMDMNNVFEESQQDEDQENRMPQSAVSVYQKSSKAVPGNTTRLVNLSKSERHLDPCSWSQSSNSSQVIVDYQQAEWETRKPEQKSNTTQRQSVTWQLFDFISDSD